jgi:hypothetical protein
MVFDLDGPLVQTEQLKPLSCAGAAVELCPYTIGEAEEMDAFREVVGPPHEVARRLVNRDI